MTLYINPSTTIIPLWPLPHCLWFCHVLLFHSHSYTSTTYHDVRCNIPNVQSVHFFGSEVIQWKLQKDYKINNNSWSPSLFATLIVYKYMWYDRNSLRCGSECDLINHFSWQTFWIPKRESCGLILILFMLNTLSLQCKLCTIYARYQPRSIENSNNVHQNHHLYLVTVKLMHRSQGSHSEQNINQQRKHHHQEEC